MHSSLVPDGRARQKTSHAHAEQLRALYVLSDMPKSVTPDSLLNTINEAPDPQSALQCVLNDVKKDSDALRSKWRQVVTDLWSAKHPHIPMLLDLPISSIDVADAPAVQDALAFLNAIRTEPAAMEQGEGEWLLSQIDAHRVAKQLPSLQNVLFVPYESEWQYPTLRRLRAVCESLMLVRRVKGRLHIVKSRYGRFAALPSIQQFYLLWHADAYHIDWSQFAGIWADYVRVLQQNASLLWSLTEDIMPDMPRDLRQWNRDVWDIFYPVWESEGLLDRTHDHTALMSIVRVHALPTAITRLVMVDLLQRYNVVYGEGSAYALTQLGVDLLEAESLEDLPCALDLIK